MLLYFEILEFSSRDINVPVRWLSVLKYLYTPTHYGVCGSVLPIFTSNVSNHRSKRIWKFRIFLYGANPDT